MTWKLAKPRGVVLEGDNRDRNICQVWSILQPNEDIEAIAFGCIQVEEDRIGHEQVCVRAIRRAEGL